MSKNPLFNQRLLNDYYKRIDIPDDKINDLVERVFNLPEKSITMGKKSGNEENVKNKVVLQILKFLGFDEQLDLNYEVSTLRKSIDVAIKLSEEETTSTALIEVKYWKKNLDELRKDRKYKSDVQQGLIYALESGIDWFIITNGFEWRFYKTFISGQIVYNFYEDFNLETLKQKENLQKFYLLFSKDSFKKDLQSKLFSETELLKEKINEDIFEILVKCRSKLFVNIFKNNKSITEKEIMEMGQKILDRLVFIRFAEDNNLFMNKPLNKSLNIWKNLPKNMKERNPLYNFIKDLFSYIREGNEKDDIFGYDGELFEKDELVDKLTIDNDIIEGVINNLNKYPDGKYIDFAEIPIDILGQIYEKYLALSLQIKDESSGLVLEEKSTKATRKKTGIYYTPKYIVNFIIENTILRKLNKDLETLPEIKIVDPACGSGAFLSQAYDLLYLKYEEYNEVIAAKTITEAKKLDIMTYIEVLDKQKTEFNKKILTNNLFGVDINPESVEITKMSLWFKTAQKNIPLNKLEANIKCGDSLIEKLELSMGKAFNWNENFPSVFNEGGFDIIIGNPPYFKIKKDNPITQLEEYNDIKIAVVNAAAVFLIRSFKFLKDKALLGFIVPKQVTFASSWRKIRKKIFDDYEILYVIDCGKAFKGVKLEQVIIILKKEKNNKENVIKIGKAFNQEIKVLGEVKQSICEESDKLYLDYNSIIHNIREKIEKKSELLGNLAKTQGGVGINYLLGRKGVFKQNKSKKDNLIVIRGNDIQRYHLRSRLYFDKTHPEMERRRSRIIEPPIKKIVVQRIVAHIRDHIKITATIDDESSITFDTVITIIPNDLNDIYYILGLLNSDLISYYFYKIIYNNAIRSMDFVSGIAKLTPIFKADEEEKKTISKFVKKLEDLNHQLLTYNLNVQKIYEKYSGVKKTKLKDIVLDNFYKLLLKKDKKISVREIEVNADDELLIIKINNKEFLKLQIKDPFKRKYLHYFIDSLDTSLLSIEDKKVFQAFKDLEIDDFDDVQSIKVVIKELEKFDTKTTLKRKISELEKKFNKKIFQIYGLNEEEIKYIEDSFF